MVENKFEEALLPNEQRKLVINGKRYYSATGNLCAQCMAEDRFMFIKLRIPNGDLTLECPNCDSTVTVKESMVNLNLNKIR